MGFDGRPDIGCRVLVDAWQRSGLLQRLHRYGNRGFGIQILEEFPTVLNQLTERVFGPRDGERRQGDREPTVRRAQQDCPRLFVALVVEMIEMGVPASAARQIFLPGFAEGVRHAARCAAGIALHPQVLGLQ
jgi:hypothetical protein